MKKKEKEPGNCSNKRPSTKKFITVICVAQILQQIDNRTNSKESAQALTLDELNGMYFTKNGQV